ncbi:FBXL8 [Acanthosepion pharaonis]|uniref:FBXL8 n=1 Tax=Acanthosepion pharaonis TaxID=158019 RepID=A0A812E2J0_ACAPH|nr:FBXL8 [Sepia pharaonis]
MPILVSFSSVAYSLCCRFKNCVSDVNPSCVTVAISLNFSLASKELIPSLAGTMDWSELPDHIIIQIFSYLPLFDRFNCCLTCKAWNQCFGASCLWQAMCFQFFSKNMSRSLQCLEKYGHFLKKVCIELDQSMDYNRINALKVMDFLSKIPNRRLTSLTIVFKSENPLFYAGKEFVEALKQLFSLPPSTDCDHKENNNFEMARLKEVNLSQLDVAYDNSVFDLLSVNHPSLEVLNIQNRVLVSKVTWDCMYRLVEQCLYLRELHVFHSSLSDEVLFLLAKQCRPQVFEYLSIKCRIDEKYHPDLTVEAWSAVTTAHPRLRVKLHFDHTCPQDRVLDIMQPVIPVVDLHLDTFTMLHNEVQRAGDYYSATLQITMLIATHHKYFIQSSTNFYTKPDMINKLNFPTINGVFS